METAKEKGGGGQGPQGTMSISRVKQDHCGHRVQEQAALALGSHGWGRPGQHGLGMEKH